MKKWVKVLIVVGCVAIGTIFFGSIVFTLLGYTFDFLSTLMDWLATASRWLAKLVDIFGFTGFFNPADSADTLIITHNVFKILTIGG